MILSTFAAIPYISMDALAASDQDGDGLTYGLEYLMNTAPNDPDSDNDGLPDGWEWQYGLDPLSSTGGDGAVGDPDGDGMSNLQEYSYLQPKTGTVLLRLAFLTRVFGGTVQFQSMIGMKKMHYNTIDLHVVTAVLTGQVA